MLLFYIALGIATLVAPSMQNRAPLKNMTVIHAWNNLEYGFESLEDYEYAIRNRIYIEDGYKRPYDADMSINLHDKNRAVSVFISTPRVVPGIPYTLAKVSNKRGKYGLKLEPYPNFKAHLVDETRKCDGIISVFRMQIDSCDRLWAIDNGRNFSNVPSFVCPPKILVYDLRTNKLILKYVIPEEQYNAQTVYNGIMVSINQSRGQCQEGKAYLTDARGFSFLVFDLARRNSWVIYNDLFKTDPAYVNTTINGETFTFTDGLYTSTPDRKRNKIYLHSYTSRSEIAAKLSTVNDQRIWENNPSGNQDVFKIIGMRKTQSPVQALDFSGNNLFFSQFTNPLSLLSWNPDTSYEPANFKILVESNQQLPFMAGLKVKINTKGEEIVLGISNNLQKLNTGSIKLSDDNYLLLSCRTKVLLSGIGHCGGL